GLSGSTIYSYAVSAVDKMNNQSAQSSTASTSTPACTSTGGTCTWSIDMGGTTSTTGGDAAYPNGVKTDAKGNVVMAGRYDGVVNFGGITLSSSAYTDDVFIAKYSSGGALQWARGFGSTGSDVATGAAVDSSGNLVIAGYFQGTVDFGNGPVTAASTSS